MNKDLAHQTTAHVHVLNLLRCDVLPLRQLKDVLLPVNYLQDAALLGNRTNTSNFWPSV